MGANSPLLVSRAWDNVHILKKVSALDQGHPGVRSAEPKDLSVLGLSYLQRVSSSWPHLGMQGHTAASIANGAAAIWRTKRQRGQWTQYYCLASLEPCVLLSKVWRGLGFGFFDVFVGNYQGQKPEFGEESPRTMRGGGSKDERSHSLLLLRVWWPQKVKSATCGSLAGAGPLKAARDISESAWQSWPKKCCINRKQWKRLAVLVLNKQIQY